MVFRDRDDAAHRLAGNLARFRGLDPLVLAIPRGGVPMGRIIADALGGELDVVLVRKIGAPFNPEFAVGAIDEQGRIQAGESAAAAGASGTYLETQGRAELALLRARRARYTPVRPVADPAHRLVIVVDDGLATGETMIAALRSVRARQPARLIAAVPVAPPETLARVGGYADEVVCLETPAYFTAVGQFYRDFPQVEDAQVIAALMARAPARRRHHDAEPD